MSKDSGDPLPDPPDHFRDRLDPFRELRVLFSDLGIPITVLLNCFWELRIPVSDLADFF